MADKNTSGLYCQNFLQFTVMWYDTPHQIRKQNTSLHHLKKHIAPSEEKQSHIVKKNTSYLVKKNPISFTQQFQTKTVFSNGRF